MSLFFRCKLFAAAQLAAQDGNDRPERSFCQHALIKMQR